MDKSFEISVPQSLRDIKLGDWQKYLKIYEKNKDAEDGTFLTMKMLQIFCGMNLGSIRDIPVSYFDEIVSHLGEIFEKDNTDRVNQFSLIGTDGVEVTFGLIPKLDDMSYGECQDLEEYIYDNQSLHRAMAVLYRPLAMGKGKDRYLIHPYKGTEEMASIMKEMPLDIALSSRVFFYNLAKKLGNSILSYTLHQSMQEKGVDSENLLGKNGENIKRYMNSLTDNLKILNKSQSKMFTQHYTS